MDRDRTQTEGEATAAAIEDAIELMGYASDSRQAEQVREWGRLIWRRAVLWHRRQNAPGETDAFMRELEARGEAAEAREPRRAA